MNTGLQTKILLLQILIILSFLTKNLTFKILFLKNLIYDKSRIKKKKDCDNVETDISENNKKDFTVIKSSENKDLFKKKILTADVFEKTGAGRLKTLIAEAKDIEITLDFISYGGNLVKKLMSKVLPKL